MLTYLILALAYAPIAFTGFVRRIPRVDRSEIGCGQKKERCCTLDEIEDALADAAAEIPVGALAPAPDYRGFDETFCWNPFSDICFDNVCTPKRDLPCGELGEDCCDVDALGTKYLDECFDSNLFCVDGTCTARGDLPCGGFEEPCCSTTEDYKDYNTRKCFYNLYCIEGLCQGRHVLDCGQSGERCCTPLDNKEIGSYYNYYDDGQCFSPAVCTTSGLCTTCNSEGDSCCEDIDDGDSYCSGQLTCEDGKCAGCGELGQICCPIRDAYSSTQECTADLDCLGGFCQYCGLHQASCCGEGQFASCKKKDLTCDKDTLICELCGQQGEPCCGGTRCADEYLQCLEGVCTCGGEGQRCCDVFCDDEKLSCGRDKICKKKNSD